MDPRRLLVSNAIPYVNARPHLGFALETVLSDAVARHARARGREVRFVGGTDENSLKNVLAAERAGVPPEELVARNAASFAALGPALDLSHDVFVRTSVDPRHRHAALELWRRCAESGDLYRSRYRGLYCVGCEAFRDPEEGERCLEHDAPLERVDEENWFFRLSRFESIVRHCVERIQPESARAELRSLLERGLRDVSVSRDARRARGTGFPVPGDPSQVLYVWFDALAVYLAGAGDDDPWAHWERSERVHVIGKGVARFHAALWPAILASAGLAPPDRLLVHGYLTVDGKKISKSGTSVDPFALVDRFGTDAIRHALLRHVRSGRDGDLDEARIEAARTADLANGLGNLLGRVTALVERACAGRVPPVSARDTLDHDLLAAGEALPSRVDDAVDRFALDEATGAIFDVVASANRYVDRTTPWVESSERAGRLAVLVGTLRAIGNELAPFLPSTSASILERVGRDQVRHGPPLFPR
ncbi:MAG: methionine--tRNA ligase [Polyangiales bacterium]